MDNPNITMEEYIRLQEEKARRQGRTFDWQTARYDKREYYETEDDSFTDLRTEYPAIVLDDISDATFSREPTVSPLDNNEIDFNISFDESDDEDYMIVFDENSFSCKIISVDNLKTDSENENDKVNMPSSPSPELTIGYFDDLEFFKDFENEFTAIDCNDLKSKFDPLNEPSVNMAPLPYRDLRHPWIRYQVDGYDEGIVHNYEQRHETIWGRPVNQVHVLDFAGLTDGMRQTLGDKLSMVYARDNGEALFTSHAWRRVFELGGARRRMTWRQFILALGLHSEEEMAEPGFGAYWDFLGPTPSYVYIKGPVRRLCHKMIACSIYDRGQGAKKVTGVDLFYLQTMDRGTANVPYLLAQYLFHHAEGRKSRARLSGGHFIGRLAAHFGLVGDQGLRGLFVVVSELPVIDLHELVRLNICARMLLSWLRDSEGYVQSSVLGTLAGNLSPAHHRHQLLSPNLCHRGSIGLRRRCARYDKALWDYEELLRALSPSRPESPRG
ncbi:hypothetical protein Tco_1331434 [Tanacetum coccineum]